MTSEKQNQLLIALGKELQRKKGSGELGHPTSVLYECSQITRVNIEFNECPMREGQTMFVCEAVYGGSSSQGSGSTKKEAKKNAAKNFLSKALESVESNMSETEEVEDSEDQSESEPEPVGDKISHWREMMSQLDHKQTDSVTLLSIFALNSSTGSPKYQVVKTVTENNKKVGYRVMTTWNMFFMEAEAETRVEAETKSALKMVNKIRELCGLDLIPEEKCLEKSEDEEEEEDAASILSDEDIPKEIRVLLTKHATILTDETKDQSCVKKLEIFSSRIECPVLPSYVITNVLTDGCQVTVEVKCTWLSLTSTGQGNNKSLAEEDAASKMISDTKKIVNMLKKTSFPTAVEKELNPVQYLIYPSNKNQPADQTAAASVTVTSNDYLCLQTGQYLNDVIIDFYLNYLQCSLLTNNPMISRTYIFSIYFYSRLITKSRGTSAIPSSQLMHNNVKKWTKNVNIFQKDFIVIPINECDHWFVVIICFPNLRLKEDMEGVTKRPIMIILDSLEDGLKSSVCVNLRSYLSMEWRAKMGSEREFSVETMPAYCPRIPQQTNLTDCGLFLLQYVESFFLNPLTNYSRPLKSLASWFPEDCIKTKRFSVASIIRELSAEYQTKANIQFPNLDFGCSVKSQPKQPLTSKPESLKVSKATEAESSLKRKTTETETDVKKYKEEEEDCDLVSPSDPAINWLEDY